MSHPHHHAPLVRTVHHDLNERPFLLVWEVTRACQLVCKHCRADAQFTPDPLQLTTEEGKALLDDLAGYPDGRPMVIISGGDAFERDDLAELIRHGTEAGLPISLSPSVTPKFTDERLAELSDAGVKAMSLSLDGATATTHDAFRGIDGSFAESLRAADLIRKHGFRFQVNTTICADNLEELPQIVRTVRQMGAHLWYVLFLVPMGRGSHLSPLTPEQEEDVLNWLHDVSDWIPVKVTEAPNYRRIVLQRDAEADGEIARGGNPAPPRGELYDRLLAETRELLGEPERVRVRRPPIGVNSGRGFAFIDHVGHVHPSGFLPHDAGSVRDRSFRDIYREDPMFRALRDPSGYSGKCGVCEFNDVCGGSRARAFAMTGDPLASDPTCAYQPRGA
ncbi:MAG: TIGR04053 family radical SAM/SPASM domain-containing protein [Propionibacterium sp.]|nr:TIGR04053 family radical SAM/SPASM domain-containing protein [Propionibacterium sp.]